MFVTRKRVDEMMVDLAHRNDLGREEISKRFMLVVEKQAEKIKELGTMITKLCPHTDLEYFTEHDGHGRRRYVSKCLTCQVHTILEESERRKEKNKQEVDKAIESIERIRGIKLERLK